MSDYPDLDAILKKYAKDWTNEEHNTVLEYMNKLGRETVQRIMDEQRNDLQSDQ